MAKCLTQGGNDRRRSRQAISRRLEDHWLRMLEDKDLTCDTSIGQSVFGERVICED